MKTTALFFVLFNAVFVAVLTDQSLDEVPELQFVEPDPDLEKYLREAIENFREQMKVGIEAIKMPVLDPLELKNLDINVLENLATLDLKIRKITVLGLSSFNFRDIYPDLENFYLEFNFTMPSLTSHGKYNMNGKLLRIFPVRGNGTFEINITNVEIGGLGQLEFINDTLQMTKLELNLTWKNLGLFLENFLGGGKFSEVLQKLIPALGKTMFDNFKPTILELMNSSLINQVNKQLQRPEVKKIIDGILPNRQ
ncbi:uncharacterized protein [Parasteatoda tepidariorum]|uniref:uncharacterized protein isoform X1 n=1 Tax=Parasteatoda tepidariorum TaxID=114398 RepID=UPI001C71FC48|nr:uncharacterized protein LOC107437106 isoform X1 [Parasteatoda tepidariorum]XP_042897427.1 uncharacterized protein LOC107437106 isoform X1 [Parasteatoda tepidariorum]